MVDLVSVPNVPGVPDVAFAALDVVSTLLTADDPSVLFAFSDPQWGVFDGGSPIIVADTVADLGYTQEWAISNYPLEQGAFASYNKVQTPFQARVRFAAGASSAARETLLASIEAIAGDLNLYDVVTPERTYVNANVVRYDYRRTAQDGVGLLLVEVTLQEVRLAGSDPSTGMTNTQAPSGADQQNGGTVQGVPVATNGLAAGPV